MHIRAATKQDRDHIHSVHWSAFGEGEREVVADLAVNLLLEETSPQIISLVAETEGIIVGHVALSPVTTHKNENFQGYILAPLAVKPDYQKGRIGTKLIETGLQQLRRTNVDIILVYGDPEYYSKFGFSFDGAECYIPPYKLQYPLGWQGISFSDRSVGRSSVQIVCVASLNDPVLW